jgi:hypothetical protein
LFAAAHAADPYSADAGDGSWQWNAVAGSKCMSGAETGVYVRYSKSGSKNFGIYLYGGGACFNTLTCRTATSNPHPDDPGTSGIFDARSDNPLLDYNWMAVPYCTGDVHAGEAESPSDFAVHRDFSGHSNLVLMMERATETFKNPETLFVTGESAGGFGSLASYVTMRDYYPSARGVLMDDSGPILDDTALPPCLQEKMRSLWNLNKNLPSDCPCNNDKGDLVSAWSYIAKRYPSDSFSLISSVDDKVISTFFAFSNDDCHAVLPVGYKKLYAGLQQISETTPTYLIPGNTHTHTSSDEFFSRVVNNQSMYKWVGQLMDPNQADPSSVQPTDEDHWFEYFEETPDTRANTIAQRIV